MMAPAVRDGRAGRRTIITTSRAARRPEPRPPNQEMSVRQFHHIGIPTAQQREGETYIEGGKVHITDAEACPYQMEFLRFEADSPMPEALQTTPHVAFMVDDLAKEMEGQQVLLEPFSPMAGLTVAFIMHDGAPVELMQKG
jgi:hypothetical protein